MKKIRKNKKKQEAKMAELTSEEREDYLKQKYEKTLKEKVGTLLWDWENNQLPRPKELYAICLVKERLQEINSEIEMKKNTDQENPQEYYKTEIAKINKFLEVKNNG